MSKTRPTGKIRDNVFTSPDVVKYMLDLSGYTPDRDLSSVNVIEPSCGEGEFVIEIIARLIRSAHVFGFNPSEAINRCLICYDIDQKNIDISINRIHSHFPEININDNIFRNEDFLIADVANTDLIIGNPPYVRHEQIALPQKELYRKLFPTFRYRADLYVAFFEKSLRSLRLGGKHCFICSNRWMKNQYGHNLRNLISSSFRLLAIVNLEKVNPFQEEVIAYPAISLIENSPTKESFQYIEVNDLNNMPLPEATAFYYQMPRNGNWNETFHTASGINKLTSIEDMGFKIGIGVATGADKIFIGKDLPELIEEELLLPILTSKDIRNNRLCWSGNYIFNPFDENGKIIDLYLFPKAKAYLEAHQETLQSRYVSQKKPSHWYRTIDRIYKELVSQPKILLPDISANSLILIDNGHYYPHHNLYYITGGDVDSLKMLSAVLMSDFITSQLSQLANHMNGGYPRWQSQYIRKLRVPDIHAIAPSDSKALISSYDARNLSEINTVVNNIIA